MERSLYKHLKSWILSKTRKPLIVLGARQVGKTFLLRVFGKQQFKRCHEFNFHSMASLHKIFKQDLNPERILRELEFTIGTTILRDGQDLVFFDEIQDCPEALASLKYFCDTMPELPIVAAGSLLGLHLAPNSFPVGKVDLFHMYPMSFSEFVGATCTPQEIAVFKEAVMAPKSLPEIAHEKFWLLFKSYLITGGLPEVVSIWITHGGIHGGLNACNTALRKLVTLITSYSGDITKHAGKVNAMHIERVWRNVSARLANAVDESTSRFMFKDVIPGISSYRDLAGPIDWLQKSGMIIRVPICHKIESPIAAFTKDNIFKLYTFDCGILAAMLSIKPGLVMDYDFGTYKGFYVENFVAQELLAAIHDPAMPITLHAWSEGRAEVEFLLETSNGVVPIEVKSGSRIRAKSLQSYVERYHPKVSVVLSARLPSIVMQGETKMVNLPIYLASALLSM